MNHKRPINLNLFTIRFPLPAIISILHRVSGAALFILIPAILWLLDYSLTSDGYDDIQLWLESPMLKFIFWILLIPFCYHLVAGVRHLLSDIHIGDTLKAGNLTAKLALIISGVFVVLLGLWLW
ncbi:MAG: hypothetical protein ACD_46C00514G0004 [uncultured bacterium]|nr:MAG: hypothetical protein ACD_46C00514G0004 [uncultured bacterium]